MLEKSQNQLFLNVKKKYLSKREDLATLQNVMRNWMMTPSALPAPIPVLDFL